MNTQAVGRAEVKKEGLYYRFFCTCTPPDNGIYRIVVCDGSNTRDIGICIPTGTVARVPIKYLPGERLTFSLVPKDRKETAVPVATGEPFERLEQLDNARFQVTQGQPEILIDPAQDPQDSDPSQEPLQKWEQP